MIVVTTSSVPRRVRSQAGTADHNAPATAAATSAGAIQNTERLGAVATTITAAVAPASNCPSAPMLSTLARSAIVTPMPVSSRGMVRTSVADRIASGEPSAPRQSADRPRTGSKPVAQSSTNMATTAARATATARTNPALARRASGRNADASGTRRCREWPHGHDA